MFAIKPENMRYLFSQNITIREFPVEPFTMTQPPSKVIHLPKIRMLRGARSGIRITNVKSIRPPDPEAVKQQEENKLRAQLQKEIVSRSRTCANKSYECHLPVITGRQFCAQHILQDPTAPYRQCVYTCGNGARCTQPAPADGREQRDQGLCYTHARAAMRARARAAAPPPPVTTTETLLHQLNHYVRPERPRTSSCTSAVSVVSDPSEPEPVAADPVDPFKQIDATAVNAAYSASIMECCSASDSDADSVTLGPGGDCRAVHEDALSDYEDAPAEDAPLWRAGVYTAEEAVSEAKKALCSLQAAYTRQMGRLGALLRAARLHYLRRLRAEREQYCSINSQARGAPTTARERRQLRKLKAFASYRRKLGVDAVLARKLHRKRAKVKELHPRAPPAHARCTFSDEGARCAAVAAPAAKHCLKHIMADRHQVLFTRCGDPRGLSPCREPRARLPLPSAACRHHTMPPAYTVFTLKKDDSDSDESHTASEASHLEEHR